MNVFHIETSIFPTCALYYLRLKQKNELKTLFHMDFLTKNVFKNLTVEQ